MLWFGASYRTNNDFIWEAVPGEQELSRPSGLSLHGRAASSQS